MVRKSLSWVKTTPRDGQIQTTSFEMNSFRSTFGNEHLLGLKNQIQKLISPIYQDLFETFRKKSQRGSDKLEIFQKTQANFQKNLKNSTIISRCCQREFDIDVVHFLDTHGQAYFLDIPPKN